MYHKELKASKKIIMTLKIIPTKNNLNIKKIDFMLKHSNE